MRKLESVDIPQADSLALVRRVVKALDRGRPTIPRIAARTGFSPRHVHYRLQTARVLGLIDDENRLTRRGRRLLGTRRDSHEERKEFRRAVGSSAVVRIIAPGLLSSRPPVVDRIAGRIAKLTGLSPATAARRANTLRSWSRQLAPEQR